ncbi:15822_t:CDS:2 [Funneliformis geosporum]|uniref:13316_t:CDS:1 n=1 Tax=Funneliformis geosporum TaxID=1117311 RepID=A0A9W4T3W2_9GLOM|nr:13316_t:CDS:2 [Funneliformis geosporum]CAI2191422.1 15822_t:CDS:2 [Funneliformis geosporum]
MSLYNTLNRKKTLAHENSRIFQYKYCLRIFSRCDAFRNYLQTHRDQMYLDENELTLEKNTNELRRTVINNTLQRIVLSPILFNDTISQFEKQPLDINDECEEQCWIKNDENFYNVLILDKNSESETNNDEEEGNDEIDVINVGNKEQNYTLLVSQIKVHLFQLLLMLDQPKNFRVQIMQHHQAYKAFVQLLVKHHLSDSVANDIIGLFNNFYMDPMTTLPSNAKAA